MSRVLTGLGVLLVALNGPVEAGTFTFRDGDRVVLLGNTLIERAQRYGHLETARNRQIATCNTAIARFAGYRGHAHVDLFTPLDGLSDATRPGSGLLFTVDGRALDSTGYRLVTADVTAQLFGTTSLTVRIIRINGTDQAVVDGPLAASVARYQPGRTIDPSRPAGSVCPPCHRVSQGQLHAAG